VRLMAPLPATPTLGALGSTAAGLPVIGRA
jgi:hypothetical protein